MWCVHTMEYYLALERNLAICGMDETGGHHVKWNESDMEGQVLHNTTYIRNLK